VGYRIFTAPNASTKTNKSLDYDVYSLIMYWSPANVGGWNVCSSASSGCIDACLNTAGHGQRNSVQDARLRRKMLFRNDRDTFWRHVMHDINKGIVTAYNKGMKFAVRMNGTSDMMWERVPVVINGKRIADSIMDLYRGVQFYDYTKHDIWKRKKVVDKWPENYDLTFSRSESNNVRAVAHLYMGYRVAAVFEEQPDTWKGFNVVNQDKHDLTYIQPSGTVLALSAKGKAKKDTSGFVIREIDLYDAFPDILKDYVRRMHFLK